MARPVYMLDFSVFKPPEEYRLNHDAGIVNASKWSVSLPCVTRHGAQAAAMQRLWSRWGTRYQCIRLLIMK